MWAYVPVVRLRIRAGRLARNIHGCWDAKAGVVDLHDPRVIKFHTDDGIVANAAPGSRLADDWVALYGESCVGREAVVRTNEDGLCPNSPVP